MYEKRVHIRVPIGVEGSYQPVSRLAPPRLGMTRDISLGGARFVSTERLEPGGKVSLTLSLPKEGELIFTGLVVWSRMAEQGTGQVAYESGLCWQSIEPHAQARLNSFLTDYTRSDSAVVISSLPPHGSEGPSWTRAAVFGLTAALLIGAAAALWVRIQDLSAENQALKGAVQSYRHQIDRVAEQYSR